MKKQLTAVAAKIFFIFSVVLLFFSSCRKQDHVTAISDAEMEKRFFSLSPSVNPALREVVEQIKKENDRHHFVPAFVRRNGYPDWEKALISATPDQYNRFNQRSNSADSQQAFVIPFIQNGEVKAYLACLKEGHNYRFTNYNKSAFPTVAPADSVKKNKLISTLSVFAYFEKELHGKSQTSFQNNYAPLIRNVNIDFRANASNHSGRGSYGWVEVTICREVWEPASGWNEGTEPGGSNDYGRWRYRCETSYFLAYMEDTNDNGGGGNGSGSEWWNNDPWSGGGGGGGGGTPGFSGTVLYLENLLQLNSSQTNWLASHPTEAEIIYRKLQENSNHDPDESGLVLQDPSNEAIIASKITIDAAMYGLITEGNTSSHWNVISSHLPNASSYQPMDPVFWMLFRIRCAIIRSEHPNWSDLEIYWEAISDIIHLGLDLAGLVPVVGEIADLANGVIYTIEGDGVNAALSYSAMLPVAGWYATGIKYCKKAVTLASGSKVTLQWIKQSNNLIHFGDRGQLRKILGLAKGDPRKAHHIIPWVEREHMLVQKAAQGNNAFHMNELFNGIPISTLQHNHGHPGYITKVRNKLNQLWHNNGGASMSPQTARQLLDQLINDIKTQIQNNPNAVLDNLNF